MVDIGPLHIGAAKNQQAGQAIGENQEVQQQRANDLSTAGSLAQRAVNARQSQVDAQQEALNRQHAAQMAAASAGAPNAANAAQINQAAQAQFRQGQMGLMGTLQNQVAGVGPSLALSTLRQGQERNLGELMAAQAAARNGASPAAQSRMLAMSQAAANQQAAQQASDIRAQEQLNAEGLLAGVSATGRGQDIGLATSQAGLQQGANLQNAIEANRMAQYNASNQQQANLTNAGLSAQLQGQQNALNLGYGQLGLGTQEANRQAALGIGTTQLAAAQNMGQQDLSKYGIDTGANAAANQGLMQLGGAAISAVGQGMASSDERNKADIRPASGGDPTPGVLKNAAVLQAQFPGDTEAQGAQFLNGTGGAIHQANQAAGVTGGGMGGMVGGSPFSRLGGMVASGMELKQGIQPAGASHGDDVGSFLQRFGQGASAASDERVKTHVAKEEPRHHHSELDRFLDQLEAYTYRYKEPGKFGEGRRLGIMAQDMERTDIGRSLVHDTPEGKAIEAPGLANAAMAAAVDLHRRVEALEGKKRG